MTGPEPKVNSALFFFLFFLFILFSFLACFVRCVIVVDDADSTWVLECGSPSGHCRKGEKVKNIEKIWKKYGVSVLNSRDSLKRLGICFFRNFL